MQLHPENKNITLKGENEIAKMREVCRLTAKTLEMISEHVRPGVTTKHLDQLCYDFIVNECKAYPAPLNYPNAIYPNNPNYNYPNSICTSINHVVCHGIPSDKPLKDGDILNIDVSLEKDGFYGDSSKMFFVGKQSPKSILANRLINTTQECLYSAIRIVKPGIKLGDIGSVIQTKAMNAGFSVVKEYCGHGIGTEFHEEPQVLHYGMPNTGITLLPGMIFTIEPMINAGKAPVSLLQDKWTVTTKDKSLSAQWEHTILVTNEGYEVLTLRAEEKI